MSNDDGGCVELGGVKVFRPYHPVGHAIADASCFYFPFVELSKTFQKLTQEGKEITALPGRIEVSDKVGPLHYHNGVTIVSITAGYGLIRTTRGDISVRVGDIAIISYQVKHLSVAGHGTTMIEHIVFFGAKGDQQSVYE